MISRDGFVKVWVEYVLNHFSYHTHNYLQRKNDKREAHSLQQEVVHLKLQLTKFRGSLKMQQFLMNSR